MTVTMFDMPWVDASSIDRDWRRVRFDADALLIANGWQLVETTLHDLDELVAAIDVRRSRDPANVEPTTRALLRCAADEQLAARVLLQRLMPALIVVAARRRRECADRLADLLAAAWIAVRTFNPDRRPTHLVPTLVRDAEHRVFRPTRRRVVELPTIFDVDQVPDDHPVHPLVELAEVIRNSNLDERDRAVVTAILNAETHSPAVLLGVTDRSVRNYRRRVVHRIREAA